MPISQAEAVSIIDAAWGAYDKDGNGFLDRTEASNLFRELFASEGVTLDQTQLDVIISAVDNNADNKITKEEMIQLLVENL